MSELRDPNHEGELDRRDQEFGEIGPIVPLPFPKIAKEASPGRGTAWFFAIVLGIAAGLVILPQLMFPPRIGGTRSARLEQERRLQAIEQAERDDAQLCQLPASAESAVDYKPPSIENVP